LSSYLQLRRQIGQDLGNRTDLDTIIANEIAERVTFYQVKPLFWSERLNTDPITLVAGTSEYTLPTTTVNVINTWFKIGNSWILLVRKPYEWLVDQDSIDPTVRGPISHCGFIGNIVRFYLTPDIVYNIRWTEVFEVAAPTADNDVTSIWVTTAFSLIRYATVEKVRRNYLEMVPQAEDARIQADRELKRLYEAYVPRVSQGGVTPHW